MPRIIPIVGCKNAGKTRTCEVLIPPLTQLGLKVGTLKYTEHDGFDWDQPGKDTFRHRTAGSRVTGIFGSKICAFSLNDSDSISQPIESLVRVFYRTLDLVLIEGYRPGPGAKIEVWRPEYSDRPVARAEDLLATYGANLFNGNRPHFDYGQETPLAEYILSHFDTLTEVRV